MVMARKEKQHPSLLEQGGTLTRRAKLGIKIGAIPEDWFFPSDEEPESVPPRAKVDIAPLSREEARRVANKSSGVWERMYFGL